MRLSLKYGSGTLELTVPDGVNVTQMSPTQIPVCPDVPGALRTALRNPLSGSAPCQPLHERPAPASVAIAVPDETRPAPLKVLLPILLEHLHQIWPSLAPADIRLVVGGGLHPQPDAAQMARILPPEILSGGYTLVGHDALHSPMRSFGVTSRGTPVLINAAVGDAECRIVIGMIDPHQFVGMTGGSKGVTIGCGAKALIEHNHSLMSQPGAFVGNVRDNPVRLDLHEAGQRIGLDLAINVVLNPAKEVVALFAGDPVACMEAGAAISSSLYGNPCDEPFDIVIASCGGLPKDLCLYQAQKGLNQASQCLKEGGRLLLLAACPQGVGDDHYYNYIKQFKTPEDQLAEFAQKGFRMGAHKALMFSQTLTRFEVAIHSDLNPQTLATCHLRKVDAQQTLDAWLQEHRNAPDPVRLMVIPNANTTYFYRSQEA